MLSDEELLELYRDKTFPGAYSGGRNFKIFLKTEKGEDIPLTRIYRVLKTLPSYIISQRRKRRFPRRSYDVAGYGILVQADLAFMFEKDGFNSFLTVVDVFSRKIFIELLKSKKASDVQKAFENIYKEFGAPISEISTDQGKEFVALRNFFEQQDTRLTFKYGANKANFAEHAIYLIKRKLYFMLRDAVTDDWPKYISFVVESLNSRHLRSIGFTAPKEIKSELDDVKIREAQRESGIKPPNYPEWKVQDENQANYEKSFNPFQQGAYVYLDDKVTAFDKSYYSLVIFSQYLFFDH